MKRPPLKEVPEFSRVVDVGDIPSAGLVEDISANAAERAALARRFGLAALDRLEAWLHVTALGGGLYRVEGRLEAEVTQQCVISLEPVPARLEVKIGVTYAKRAGPEMPEVHLSSSGEDDPEQMDGNHIDLGEAMAQQMVVALDPYPRKPGVELSDILGVSGEKPATGGQIAGTEKLGPFSKLVELRKKLT
ncbi:MAG: YceD family protein [Alphaproteobacteria bacterium]